MVRRSTEERQAEIKKAVLEIIAERGLRSLTTRNLASHLEISEGAIFKHFKNKLEIYLGIMEDVQRDLIGGLREIAHSDASPPVKLKQYLCFHVQYLMKHRGITMLLFSEAAHFNDSKLKSLLASVLRAQKENLELIIQQGQQEKIWNQKVDKESVAMLYMGIPITLNIEMILEPGWMKQEAFCDRIICQFERILH